MRIVPVSRRPSSLIDSSLQPTHAAATSAPVPAARADRCDRGRITRRSPCAALQASTPNAGRASLVQALRPSGHGPRLSKSARGAPVAATRKVAMAPEWLESTRYVTSLPEKVEGFGSVLHRLISTVLLGLGALADVIDTALHIGRGSKPLDVASLQRYRRVYHGALDTNRVRIKRGSLPQALGAAPFTVGNTIFLPADAMSDDGVLTPEGRQTLDHEIAHVWQYQNGGPSYMSRSLLAQALAWWKTGSRGGAYAWRSAVAAGKAWGDLNPEQQASIAEYITERLDRLEAESPDVSTREPHARFLLAVLSVLRRSTNQSRRWNRPSLHAG